MSNLIQLRRGPEANRTNITPAQGEPLFTTDQKKVFVGDGAVPGGLGLVMDSETSALSAASKVVRMTPAGRLDDSVMPLTYATVAYVDQVAAGLDFQADVIATQYDSSLNPGTPSLGHRYIVTNPATLHAGFGAISGVESGDIVEYSGTHFVVKYDVSVKGAGV